MLQIVASLGCNILVTVKDIGWKGEIIVYFLFFPNTHHIELFHLHRTYWVIALILSVVVCYKLISSVAEKWVQKPTIISFAEKARLISEIPFPGVVVCPIIKGRLSNFNYRNTYEKILKNGSDNVPSEEWVDIKLMVGFCLWFVFSLLFFLFCSQAHFEALSQICPFNGELLNISDSLNNFTVFPTIANIQKVFQRLSTKTMMVFDRRVEFLFPL